MRIWLTRTLSGWMGSDADTDKVLSKFPLGTTVEFDVKTRQSRSGAWHRRYWLLMSRLAQAGISEVNIRELGDDGPPIMYPVSSAEDIHTALKFICGLVHKHTVTSGREAFLYRVPKSTSFDDMTPDEWAAYWPRVLDGIHQRILPEVGNRYVEDDLARLAS
jgi:hypothetical protein